MESLLNQEGAIESAPRPAALIVNAGARSGSDEFQKARECLQAASVPLLEAVKLAPSATVGSEIRRLQARGARLLIVGGGDGTLRAAAAALRNTGCAMGVLPLGTVNDFARNLSIRADLHAACEVIAQGSLARIDVGLANEEVFLITASLGFSAESQEVLNGRLKRLLGPIAYPGAGIIALRRLRSLRVAIRANGREEIWQAVQAGVVHGPSWMGGAVQIPGLDLENGKLALYAVPPQPASSILRTIRSLRSGQFFSAPGLRAMLCKDATVETRGAQKLVLDGDLCGHTPVHFRIDRASLSVCVPPTYVQQH